MSTQYSTIGDLLSDLPDTGLTHPYGEAALFSAPADSGLWVHVHAWTEDSRGRFHIVEADQSGDSAFRTHWLAWQEVAIHEATAAVIAEAIAAVTARARVTLTAARARGAMWQVGLLAEVGNSASLEAEGILGASNLTRFGQAAVGAGVDPEVVARCAAQVLSAMAEDEGRLIDHEAARRRAEVVEGELASRLRDAVETERHRELVERDDVRVCTSADRLDTLTSMSAEIAAIRDALAEALQVRDDAIRTARERGMSYADLGRRTGLSRPSLDKIINRAPVGRD